MIIGWQYRISSLKSQFTLALTAELVYVKWSLWCQPKCYKTCVQLKYFIIRFRALTLIIFLFSNPKIAICNMETSSGLQVILSETEFRFRRACEQVVLLNNKLQDLQVRYDRARRDELRSFRYNIRLRMSGVEGVRNAYYEYARQKADKVLYLRHKIRSVATIDCEDQISDSDGSTE